MLQKQLVIGLWQCWLLQPARVRAGQLKKIKFYLNGLDYSNQFKQNCKLLGSGWIFQDWIASWQIFSHLCSCPSKSPPTTTPKCLFQVLISWKKKTKIKFRCPLVWSPMYSKVLSSSLRADRALWQKGDNSQQWIRRLNYYLSKGSACCSFVLNHQFFHRKVSPQAGELPGNLTRSQITLHNPTSKSISGVILIFPQKMWEMQKPHMGILHWEK